MRNRKITIYFDDNKKVTITTNKDDVEIDEMIESKILKNIDENGVISYINLTKFNVIEVTEMEIPDFIDSIEQENQQLKEQLKQGDNNENNRI